MSADDVKRLHLLEQETARLKKIPTERDLEIEVIKVNAKISFVIESRLRVYAS